MIVKYGKQSSFRRYCAATVLAGLRVELGFEQQHRRVKSSADGGSISCSEKYITHVGEMDEKSHHTGKRRGGRFTNSWSSWEERGLIHVLRWWYQNFREKKSLRPKLIDNDSPSKEELKRAFPVLKPKLDEVKDGLRVTWIGHATVLVQIEGFNILTDPIFEESCSPIPALGPKRVTEPAVLLDDLPRIDGVCISHNHYDHLSMKSVEKLQRRFGNRLKWFIPLGLETWFTSRNIRNFVGLDWMETTELNCSADGASNKLSLVFTPAQHWSMRSGFDRKDSLWGGWAIYGSEHSFWFAGDTGYAPVFKSIIGPKLGPFDVSAIPIGAYSPRWFMKPQHVDPEEAVKIHQEVGSRHSIAIHFATFPLTDEPLDEPIVRLKEAVADSGLEKNEFVALKHGGSLDIRNGTLLNDNLETMR